MGGDTFAVIPRTAEGKRGGVVLAQEGDNWIVTLTGNFGHQAPEDLEGYLRYAQSLPASFIYDLIREAEPIGEATVMRFPANVRNHYEELKDFPEGFLVFGDVICSFNPIYGQGMSAAALQASSLSIALAAGNENLARSFFAEASKVIDNPWNIAVGGDLKMPETVGPRGLGVRLINWYLGMLHKCAHHDAEAGIAFIRVAQLVDTPASLMRPDLAWRVLTGNLRNQGKRLWSGNTKNSALENV